MVTVEKEVPAISPAPPQSSSNDRQITLDILNRLLGASPPRTVACRLWDGTRWPADAQDDVAATVVLNHPGALRRMFLPPTERAVGEAFIRGDFDIEGDIEAACELNELAGAAPRTPATTLAILQLLRQLPEVDGPARATARGARVARAAALPLARPGGDSLSLRCLQRLLRALAR